MEEEARVILREAVAEDTETPINLAEAIAARFERVGGVGIEIPAREPMRQPPKPR
ncbi:MAG: Plasmid stabilization protein [Myxococcales bacterium]|nr:Plasmid stabilization protein [Myxococcales bacterium]